MGRMTVQWLILSFILCTAWASIEVPEGLIPKDDIEKTVKTKCERNGGSQAFDNLNNAKDTLKTCLLSQVNVTVFQDELEEAKKTGSMDEVFGKYCAKTPEIKTCVKNFTTYLSECLEPGERNTLNTTLEVLKRLGEFLCYNDGDRLAMFIAEGGVECLQSQKDNIKTCLNTTFSHKLPKEINANSLPAFLIDTEKCNDLDQLRTCVVAELEKCENSTPANIIEALFKFIYRNTCKTTRQRRHTRKSKRAVNEETIPAEPTDEEEIKQDMLKYFKTRCDKYGPKNAFKEFKGSLGNTTDCLKAVFTKHILLIHGYSTELQKETLLCCEETIQKAENCLPEQEKYFPRFYYDSLFSFIKYMYMNGAKIRQMFSTPEPVQCIRNLRKDFDRILQCFDFHTTTGKEGEGFVTKEMLCSEFDQANTCIADIVKEECPADIQWYNLQQNIFAEIKSFCSKKE